MWRSSQYWLCNVYRYTIHSNHKCQYWCPTYVFPGWYVVRWSWIPVVYPARRCDFWWDSTRSMLGEFDVPKHEVTRPSKLSKDARSSKVAWKGTRGARHLMPMHGLCQLVYSTWKFAPNVSPNMCLNERLIAPFQPLEGVDTQSMIVATNKTISIILVHNILSTIAYAYIYIYGLRRHVHTSLACHSSRFPHHHLWWGRLGTSPIYYYKKYMITYVHVPMYLVKSIFV